MRSTTNETQCIVVPVVIVKARGGKKIHLMHRATKESVLKRAEAVRVLRNGFRRMVDLRTQTGNVHISVVYNNSSGSYKTGVLQMFGAQADMIIDALIAEGIITRQPTAVTLLTGVRSASSGFIVTLKTDHTKLGD